MTNALFRFLSVAAIVLASAATATLATTSGARAETRTLDMYFTHTGKRKKFTFKRNGKYVKKGLRTFNRLVRDHRRKEATKMDPKLLDIVWETYQELKTKKPIHVISGYRSPKTNAALRRRGRKVARKSQHMRGKALDWMVPGVSVARQRAAALRVHGGGVGYYRNSFVHTDTGRVRHWPRMSRRQLAKVFPRGRTIHVPSNGKPLKGYKVAMANLKKGLRHDGKRKRYKSSGGKSLLSKIFRKDEAAAENEAPARIEKKTPPAARPSKPEPAGNETVIASRGSDLFAAEARKVQELDAPVRLAGNTLVPVARPGSEPTVQPAAAQPTLVAALDPVRPARRPAAALAGTPAALESFSVAELKARRAAGAETTAQAIAYARPEAEVGGEAAVEALAAGRAAVPSPTQQAPTQQTVPPAVQLAMAEPAPRTPRNIQALKDRITSTFSKRADTPRRPVAESLAAIRPAPLRRPAASKMAAPKTTARKMDEQVITAALQRSRSPRSAADAVQSRLPAAASFKRERTGDVTFVRLSRGAEPVPFAIGNLYGRSVKSWATARTTRRGLFATLRAPHYRLATRLPAPDAVYAVGFRKQGRLRTGRFTGSSMVKVAFQELAQLAN